MIEQIKLISESRKDFLRLLLKDPRIKGVVLLNGDNPSSVEIFDDGSVRFGLAPKKWINFLFRSYVTLEFPILAFKIRSALAQYTPKESRFKEAMTEGIIENAIDSFNYDFVVDQLFVNSILGVTEGEYKLKGIREESPRRPLNNSGGNHVVGRTTVGLCLGGEVVPIDLSIVER